MKVRGSGVCAENGDARNVFALEADLGELVIGEPRQRVIPRGNFIANFDLGRQTREKNCASAARRMLSFTKVGCDRTPSFDIVGPLNSLPAEIRDEHHSSAS
jgi:hypothetical protein